MIRNALWNWVARSVVQGRPELATTCSAASLASNYPNMARSTPLTTGIRSAPTTEMYTRCDVIDLYKQIGRRLKLATRW